MSGQGAPFKTTSMFLLNSAKYVNELNFTDINTYKLYRTILRSVNENLSRVATHYKSIIISAENGNVNVYKNKRRVYSVPFEKYLKSTGYYFSKILSYTKK